MQSSAAIVAKVRSKYGKMLKASDYKKMLTFTKLSEIVTFLKNSPKYNEILKKVDVTAVHRGYIELLLKENMFFEFAVLCRYEFGAIAYFSQFVKGIFEINQIIHFLTLLSADQSEKYILSLPAYFSSHTDIDLTAMAKALTYDDFLKALQNTPYFDLLEKFKPTIGQVLDLPKIEDELYNYVYGELYKIINSHSNSKEKVELTKIFDNIINYNNFLRIIRLKKYYKMDAVSVKEYILPFGTLSKAQLDMLCNIDSEEELIQKIASLKEGKLVGTMKYYHIGEIFRRARYSICKHNIVMSLTPSTVAISYYFVQENELQNIIKIIEGIKYNFDRDKLKTMLIY